jgi:hypothetical protein
MNQQTEAGVVKSVTVAAGRQRAFDVYTAEFGTWWPREHHVGTAELATCAFEPRAGGRWYETGVDGSECETRVEVTHRHFDRHGAVPARCAPGSTRPTATTTASPGTRRPSLPDPAWCPTGRI